MPFSNKKRTFRRNKTPSNKPAKNNKSKRIGGSIKRTTLSRRNRKNKKIFGASNIIPELLSDAEIEKLVGLFDDESKKPQARELLKKLEYEDGYVSCYETAQDTANYRKHPRNLYKQAEDKLACWFNRYTDTIK